jgi:hypothetical protein
MQRITITITITIIIIIITIIITTIAACESSMQRITEAFFKQLADVSKLQSVHLCIFEFFFFFLSPNDSACTLFSPLSSFLF